MKRLLFLLALALGTFLAVNAVVAADAKVEEEILSPAGKTRGIAVSPRGLRVAALVEKGSRFAVVVDGVEGPRIDSLLWHVMGENYYTRLTTIPVIFSADGTRYAYAAKVGGEYIIILDGKEVRRGPLPQPIQPDGALTEMPKFSPVGNHFYYILSESGGGAVKRLVMNGKPEATSIMGYELVFSADGSRYAYYVQRPSDSKDVLVVDGKETSILGQKAQFTPDNKTLVTIARTATEAQVFFNGSPYFRAKDVEAVHVSSAGLVVMVVGENPYGRGTGQYLATAGGKKVEGSDCRNVGKVVFSPDGKRYAAECDHGPTKFMMIDGKKGQEYQIISEFAFTPDSSKAVYYGQSAAKKFLVVEDEESDGYETVQPIAIGGGGKRVGFIGSTPMVAQAHVMVDGKSKPYEMANDLKISPDGSHYAFVAGRGLMGTLYLDGVEQKGIGTFRADGLVSHITFSPDGKHLAHYGIVEGNMSKRGLVVNGKLAVPCQQQISAPFFTPDSQHIFFIRPKDGGAAELVVDGKAAATFTTVYVTEGTGSNGKSEMTKEGVYTFIAFGDGAVKRIRVTPSPDTNINTLLGGEPAKATTPTTPASTTPTSPTTTQPAKTVVAPAPARTLTWADLVNHPERWPEMTKLTVQLRFDKGILKEGTAVRIEEVTARNVRLISPQDFTFVVEPKDCDLLQAANAQWAKLTPEQQAITGETLAADSTLWPGKVKVLEAQKFGSLVVKAGSELNLINVKSNEIGLMHPQAKDQLMFPFHYTDIIARSRQIALMPPEHRPGRMSASLDNITVDANGKVTPLPKAHYYVFYFAASTCPRCEVFTPKFVEHYNKSFAKREDVVFVSWPTEGSTPPYLAYARRKAIPWLTIPYERTGIFHNLGLFEIPGILVVDRFGTVLLSTNRIKAAPMEAAEKASSQLNGVLKPASMEFVSAKIPEVASPSTVPTTPQPETPATTEVKPTTETPAAQQAVEMKWLDCDKIISDCMQQTRDAKNAVRTSINRKSFDNMYRGLHVKFSGTVDSVKKAEGIVIFKGAGKWPTNYHVRASFPPDKLAMLDKFQKGQRVTLEADIADFSLPAMDVAAFGMGPSRIILLNQVKLLEE